MALAPFCACGLFKTVLNISRIIPLRVFESHALSVRAFKCPGKPCEASYRFTTLGPR